MAQIKGTNVASPVVPFDTADQNPSHEARYGKGGYRTVATSTERDAIPAPRREAGMLVYVAAGGGSLWQLGADLTTWTAFETGGGAPDAHAASHGQAGSDPVTVVIGQVTGLQTALDGKQASGSYAAASHTHAISDVTDLATALSGIDSALTGKAASSHTHGGGDISFTFLTSTFTAGTDSPVASFLWGVNEGDPGHIVDNFLKSALDNAYASQSHAHSAADITSGTLDIARLPVGTGSTQVAAGNDARFSDARTPTAHNHSASEITSGVLATARLASSGTASATTFLRGDQTWATAGSTNASDLTSGTLAYARLADPTVTSPSQITASQNDYASFARGINRFTTNAARDITGMVAGSDGEVRVLCNVGTTAANTLVIKDESTSSTAANRFSVPWNGDCVIPAEGSVVVFYDGTSSRWRVV